MNAAQRRKHQRNRPQRGDLVVWTEIERGKPVKREGVVINDRWPCSSTVDQVIFGAKTGFARTIANHRLTRVEEFA